MTDSSQASRKTRWQVRVLAGLVPLAILVAVDLGLRGLGALPPDDPLLFFVRSHEPAFSPFVERPDGSVVIRPDWINPGNGLRRRVGRDPARQFLHPGFRSARFAKRKPDDVVRVFVLGGSTAFGLYVDRQEAFAARLESGLAARIPGRRVEVINLGCAGWASARVLNVLDAVLAYDPDLVVVYSGHNEMLEGHLDAMTALGTPARIRAALLSNSSLFAWLNHAVTALLWSEETAVRAEKVAALRVGQIPTYEPRAVAEDELVPPPPVFFEAAAVGYGENVRIMSAKAEAASVPILFLLPVANLLSPPSISDQAGAHFQRASALQAAGREEDARVEYQRALDLDLRTHRITSRLEATMIGAVESEGAVWIDLRPVFRSPLEEETAAALFVDHLHPTDIGHERIARAAMPAALELLESSGSDRP